VENEYRNKSVEWNLEHFELMKLGNYTNSECVLRLKIDMQNLNHVLRDPIAYRISFTPHHKTGSKWCIYPSYDYSHGIVDALENITHSYCTDEFYIRRDLYYWSPNKLKELGVKLNLAQEIEYGKLSVENNIISKRNINRLIIDGKIQNYFDPRLLTIKGLKTRGFTPDLIKQIVECSGFDMKETIISTKFMNHLLRTKYNDIAIRVFGVIDPIQVNINNFNFTINLIHPNHPTNNLGEHQIILSNKIYIEHEDFNREYIKNFYRFMPGNRVRLRYYNDDFFELDTFNEENNIVMIKKADVSNVNVKKIKGCIHWISFDDAVRVKYELFTELAPGGTFDPNSKIIKYGYIQKFALNILDKPIQLERKGFFKFDRLECENGENIHVFIQIVELNDSKKI
jgi:glutaminyl-tRNA synthetase